MENNPVPVQKKINFYAAFGVALATIAAVIVLILAAWGLSTLVSNSIPYGVGPLFMLSLATAVLALSIGIPVLKTSKHGWRTVVTTILIQFLAQFFILVLFMVAISSLSSSSSSGGYSPYSSYDGLGY